MSKTQTQVIVQPVQAEVLLEGHHPQLSSENTSVRSSEDGVPLRPPSPASSRLQQVLVTVQLFGVTFTASVINGLVTVGLPTITRDLALPPALAFWPASVSGLATASTLLLAGSIADTVGPRPVELVGSFACGALMIGAGAARKGEELVALRALQGVGLALHLASSVAIVTQILPQGRGRNMAFSCLGLSQPLGFSVGLVVGGVLVETIGWRAGWYLCGGVTLGFAVLGLWALPKRKDCRRAADYLNDVKTKVDWVGALLASGFMALLCYLLAVLSADVYRIKSPECIVLLCLCAIALPSFVAWVHRQMRRGKPALIPNSLWKNATFSSICATIALSFAVINSLELFASLFFQEIQHLSALEASIRMLPSVVVGGLMNIVTGLFVHKVPAIWIVTITSVLCAFSPLLMAIIQPSTTYWGNAFFAQLLQPVSCDALFTVGLIVITEVFPEDTQALAGAVFNTAAQFGCALGFAVLQVISTLVTKGHADKGESQALMDGYRASFWTMTAAMVLCSVIGVIGLRKTGRVGLKRD